MGLTVNKAGVHRLTSQPYAKVGTSWRGASKVYIKKSGTWREVWPLRPNTPASASISTSFNGTDIIVNTSWTAPPGGGHPYDRFISRIVFVHPTSGALSYQATVSHTSATFSYTHTNGTTGYQHLVGWKVYMQVWAVRNATATLNETWSAARESAQATVSQLPIPAAPTSLDVNIVSCALSMTWAHAGSPALVGFQVEIWLSGYASTVYNVAASPRSHASYPWSAATVGRHTVNVRVRATGTGGYSAWITTSGVMPGPVTFGDLRFEGGILKVNTAGNYEGLAVYRQKSTAGAVFQANVAAGVASITDTASSGYARDNVSNYRLGVIPRNSLGWTGRTQWTDWAIKLPNPVFIRPFDCNTWWSIPIPGKWRTNPQADNWFYQGKSISGNSYGTLFYTTLCSSYFSVARIGYTPSVTAWDIHVKRTNTGGLVAAVALNTWLHATLDDSDNQHDAHPTLIYGPLVGPSLARDQQVWLRLPTGWWPYMASGSAKGIAFYVPPEQADNQLRSEIGNVSNRYMILDKPNYGTHLDGQPPGTLRIYHDG